MRYLARLWEKRNEQISLFLEHTEIHNLEAPYVQKKDHIKLLLLLLLTLIEFGGSSPYTSNK